MTDTKNIRGFTLIELIAVLIIIGVISIGIYSLLANIVNGFNHTRYVTDYTENLQIALTRITHEVANINTTKTYTISQSSITYYYGSDSNTSNISFSGSSITIDGYTLLENVTSFTVSKLTTLGVNISITVDIPDYNGNVSRTFATTIDLNPASF